MFNSGLKWFAQKVAVCVLAVIVMAGSMSAQTHGVLREVFTDILGSSVSDLTNNASFPKNPSIVSFESSFEAPSDFADNYGTRMRALFTPPITTNYTFWISSDDNSLLYLSTDDKPANKRLIAWVTSWTASRAWTVESNQKSTAVKLTAGSRYYMEALQKEGGGGDNLAVGWMPPGGSSTNVIPGDYLIPYGLGAPAISQTTQRCPGRGRRNGDLLAPIGNDDRRDVSMAAQWFEYP